MSNTLAEHSGGSGAMMSPFRLLRILAGYVKPYASRAFLLFVTLLVEGAFNTLLANNTKSSARKSRRRSNSAGQRQML